MEKNLTMPNAMVEELSAEESARVIGGAIPLLPVRTVANVNRTYALTISLYNTALFLNSLNTPK